MERVKRKKIPISRRIISSILAVFMAVTAIITGMSPVTAKASDGVYTVEEVSDRISYQEAFSGIDDAMANWGTNIFTVSDPSGDTYWGLCASPNKATPGTGTNYYDSTEYTNDTVARVIYWSLGNGWDDEEWGVLRDYSEDVRTIIAHHTVALAMGNDDWNTTYSGAMALGDDSKIGYQLCMELLNVAANISTGDWDCTVIYISDPDHDCQNIAVYKEAYNPPIELTGSVRFHKESAMPSISDGNSCYSLDGAEISIYSDADCTDLLDTLTTGEDGYTDYYSTTFREGDSVTLYFKETKAPKGFLINDEVRSITLDSEDSYTETISDMPGNDPITLLLKKQTADGHGSGDTRLEGAEYTVKYYDILSDIDPAIAGNEAKYTWIFRTNERGYIFLADNYLVTGSDGLVKDISGMYTLPLGTITLQETKAPEGYLLNDTVYVAQTVLDSGNNTVRTTNLPTDDNAAQETPYEGTISIQKFLGGSTVKTSEPDAEFEIYLTSAGSYDAAPEESRQTITTDANGYAITKRLPYGTYTVHQTKGNNKYYFVDDMEITISENNANYHKILEDSPIEFYIKMVKKDADTGNTVNVAGTTFELYDDNGSKISFNIMTSSGMQTIDSFTTDENGCVYTAEKLLKGNYTLVETKAPDGFVLNPDEQVVTLVYVDDKTPVVNEALTFSNDRQKVELSVSKLDSETRKPVAGAEFGLYAAKDIVNADGKVIVSKDTLLEKSVSDSNGLIQFVKDYPLGSYYAKEIKAPAGYASNDEVIDFTAAYQGQNVKSVKLSAEFLNSPTHFEFTKTDITNGSELTGATLTVLDKNGNVVDTWTSDAREAHVIKRLVVGETYTLREEYAPYGYLKATDIQFTVKDTGEVQHVNMKDEVARGSIVVTKDGEIVSDATIRKEYWNNFVFNFLKRNLSGVTFDVYAKEDILSVDGLNTVYYKAGDKISTIVTDEQGIARIDNLPCGKYYLIETKTIDGFILDNTPIEADISYIDQNTNVVYAGMNVTNERQKVQISVIKTDSETKKVLEGAVFGLFTKEDIVNADGKVIVNADTQIEKAVTGKDGKVTFTSDLPLGQYYVKELEAPAGYVKSDKVIDVDATYKGDNVKVIELEAAFENIPIKVEFSKTDITGEKELPGAKLSVIDSEGKIVESWISEAGKSHVIERLPVGKYTLREESAPYGYKVAVDVTFEITETSEIQKVIMKDEQAVGRIIINKTDSVTGSPIEGVVFEIRDKDGKVLDTLTTDKNGYAESKLLPICTYNKDGSYKEDIHYTVIETKAANGYILDEASYDVVLKYSDNAPVCIEETVKLTNTPKPDIPKTGDTGNVYRYALLALISLAVMVSLVMAKKSRNQKN